jgi:hypothetical protein
MAGHVIHMWERRDRPMHGHLEGKSSHSWDLKEIGCDVMKIN